MGGIAGGVSAGIFGRVANNLLEEAPLISEAESKLPEQLKGDLVSKN